MQAQATEGTAKQCPHCERWCLKDNACDYIFACGLTSEGRFEVGTGCGKSWCWKCGKKFCGLYIDSAGKKCRDARDQHGSCCETEEGFSKDKYCEGGHSSHCSKRW